MTDWQRLRRRARTAPSRVFYFRRDPARQLADEGLFDLEYYRAQFWNASEAPRTLRQAVAHYIATGRAEGYAYSPFVETEWYEGYYPDPVWRRSLDVALARDWVQGLAPSPVYADEGPFGTAREVVRATRAGRFDGRLIGGLSASQLRSSLLDRLHESRRSAPNDGRRSGVDWSAVDEAVADRVPGRVSILVPTYQDWRMTAESVRAALARSAGADIEVVVIENGSRPSVFRMLTALFLFEPRVRIVACDVNTNFSGGMNIGIAESTGEYIVLLNNDAVVSEGWLPPLLRVLDENPMVRGVQPLLLYPEIRRIQAAGTMFLGEGVVPWHFLAGHPVEDVYRVQDLRFNAVTAAIMVLRAAELVSFRGFDEDFANGYEDVDLCLRMVQEPGHHFRVVPESEAVHPEGSSEGRSLHDHTNRRRFFDLWRNRMPASESWRYREIGLRLEAMRPHAFAIEVPIMLSDPQLVRPVRDVTDGPATGMPCLRWVLALTTPVDEARVEALRSSLARLGQEVVSMRGGARFSDGLDDVLVAFDPEAPFTPRSATYNVLLVDDAARLSAARPVWESVVLLGIPEADAMPALAGGGSIHSADDLYSPDLETALMSIIGAAQQRRRLNFG